MHADGRHLSSSYGVSTTMFQVPEYDCMYVDERHLSLGCGVSACTVQMTEWLFCARKSKSWWF
jgi:hypothetical protein